MDRLDDEHSEPLIRGSRQKPLYRSSKRRYLSPKKKVVMILLVVLAVLGTVGIFYRCPEKYCSNLANLITHPATKPSDSRLSEYQVHMGKPDNHVDYESIQEDNFQFNFNGSDVMVFLHIQKTGGTTFGKHLVQDINLEKPCHCRKRKKGEKKRRRFKRKQLTCDCFRPGSPGSNWLFSRFSTGWKCGLHPDWTELTECVDPYFRKTEGEAKRRYFYVTFLRDPVSRYLSEFRHVQRGATWRAARHRCNGRPAKPNEIPSCYDNMDGEGDWADVSLEEFMACPSNLAVNRQTRMLSNLSLVHCYDTSAMPPDLRDQVILESAKRNLENLAFFGLTGEQVKSQYIFEETFHMNFVNRFVQQRSGKSSSTLNKLDESTRLRIEQLNHLDMKLFEFASDLMEKRFNQIKDSDPDYEEFFSEGAKKSLKDEEYDDDEDS